MNLDDYTHDVNVAALHAKGSPWHDVIAYGATGDGVTDDTAAIQAAIDSIDNGTDDHESATLFFPPSKNGYKITDTLVFENYFGLTIAFGAPALVDQVDTDARCQLQWHGTDVTKPVILLKGAGYGIDIINLSIAGNAGGTPALVGLAVGEWDSASNGPFRSINTKNMTVLDCRYGAWFGCDSGTNADIAPSHNSNWYVRDCLDGGVWVNSGNAAGIVFDNCYITDCGESPGTDTYNASGLR